MEQAPGRGRRQERGARGDARGARTEAGGPGHPAHGVRPQQLQQQQAHRNVERHGPSHALVGLLFRESVYRRGVGQRGSERRAHGATGQVKQRLCLMPCLLLRRVYGLENGGAGRPRCRYGERRGYMISNTAKIVWPREIGTKKWCFIFIFCRLCFVLISQGWFGVRSTHGLKGVSSLARS